MALHEDGALKNSCTCSGHKCELGEATIEVAGEDSSESCMTLCMVCCRVVNADGEGGGIGSDSVDCET